MHDILYNGAAIFNTYHSRREVVVVTIDHNCSFLFFAAATFTTDGRTTRARVVRNASPATTKNTKETINITLRVEGMMCEGCAETVESALKKSEDVEDVTVDLQTKIVIVKVGSDRVQSQVEAMGKIPEFVKMVTESGFDCEPVF